MDDLTVFNVLFRWIHVGTAIVVLGGSVFLRFVLFPAAEQLPEAAHEQLRTGVMSRWKRFVGLGIGLFLISGLYNYLVVTRPRHEGQPLYHALIGVKILLALAVFFLASALTGRAAAFEGIRRRRKLWLTVTILLAAAVVAISGVLKVAVPPAS